MTTRYEYTFGGLLGILIGGPIMAAVFGAFAAIFAAVAAIFAAPAVGAFLLIRYMIGA